MIAENKFKQTVEKTVEFPYFLYLPNDYDSTKKYPLLIFLHGAGERTDDLSVLYRYKFFRDLKDGKQYPFIIVAPQITSPDMHWACYTESLNIFLDGIIEKYNVDTSRIYLTGLSMGGHGTWQWLLRNPERFAAAAPVCGRALYINADRAKDIPLWVFHGTEDDVVPFSESESMVKLIRKYGGNPKFTAYEGVKHNSWDLAYSDELIEWFLQHKKN